MSRAPRRKIVTSINIEPDDYAKLKAAQDRRRVPMAFIVREIIHREVEHWPEPISESEPERAAVAV